jgi:hypothetical protein
MTAEMGQKCQSGAKIIEQAIETWAIVNTPQIPPAKMAA